MSVTGGPTLMTMPMALLAWTSLLGLLHAIATGVAVTSQHGLDYASSPRDDPRPTTGVGGRVVRSFANFMQTFPIFAAVVLVAHGVGKDHGLASWGAQFYFWGRIAYFGAYVTGSRFRTAIFFVSVFGILLILLKLA